MKFILAVIHKKGQNMAVEYWRTVPWSRPRAQGSDLGSPIPGFRIQMFESEYIPVIKDAGIYILKISFKFSTLVTMQH